MNNSLTLPTPDRDALESSRLLSKRITDRIAVNHGSIGFDEYMRMALYEPALGYYVGGAHKFGAAGDFITAPDVSPLFGAAIGEQCAQILNELKGGSIVEFSGGSGRLALSLVTRLTELGCEFAEYLIVELSPELRDRQQDLIREQAPDLLAKIHWLAAPPSQPISGIVLANEVLDSIPVKAFSLRDGELFERRVGLDRRGRFAWLYAEPPQRSVQELQRFRTQGCLTADDEFDFEICAALDAWLNELSSILTAGAALLVDYGHGRRELYSDAHERGTLRCYYRHRVHDDPFVYPGLQDITASVDFTRVAEAACEACLSVAGYTDQAQFLMACGILDRLAARHKDLAEGAMLDENEQVKTLLLPTKMGTRFKVIGLTKALEQPLLGFALRDNRHLL